MEKQINEIELIGTVVMEPFKKAENSKGVWCKICYKRPFGFQKEFVISTFLPSSIYNSFSRPIKVGDQILVKGLIARNKLGGFVYALETRFESEKRSHKNKANIEGFIAREVYIQQEGHKESEHIMSANTTIKNYLKDWGYVLVFLKATSPFDKLCNNLAMGEEVGFSGEFISPKRNPDSGYVCVRSRLK